MENFTRSSAAPFGRVRAAKDLILATAPIGIVIVAFSFLFSLPASAEIYKYTDPGGHIRYTDDLTMVPEKQREKADEYTELQSPSPVATDEISDPPSGEPSAETPPTEAELAEVSLRLKESRKALETERDRLIKVQENLEKTAGITNSKAEAKTHRERLGQFRQDALEYEKRRQSFEENLARYNAHIEALGRRAPEMEDPEIEDETE